MQIVNFEGIDRAYRKGVKVLDGVSFGVARGEVVGLLGANGAGKTTLLRIAMGMLEPQAGCVNVFGMDPREKPVEVKKRIGYVSEDQILPEFLRVRDVVRLHRGLFPGWDEELARGLGERFNIDPGAKIKTLSKGQARQVALLCAVAHRPELLVLDEPAGGLDPSVRREFLETAIQLLNDESGTTILFSSHHMADVERMAGRVVMLHEAKVLLNHSLDELRESFSLVLLPGNGEIDRDRVRALPHCFALRDRGESLHAIFQLGPDDSRSLVERELGVTAVRSQSIPLEEMFVELVGGRA